MKYGGVLIARSQPNASQLKGQRLILQQDTDQKHTAEALQSQKVERYWRAKSRHLT